jgi:uncharacterized protein (TIGR02246 family)
VDIDFAVGAPIDGAEEPVWIHGAPSRRQCTDPAIQVHQSDRHTFILRVSKAVSFEAPFIFLLFGNERAVLFDTGPSADPAKVPLRRAVDDLVGAWLAEHPREDYELVVAHTHGHHDHRDGDPQFADRPRTAVVGHTAEEVRGFYGFSQWPGQIVSFDLGGRVLELTGTPDTTRPQAVVGVLEGVRVAWEANDAEAFVADYLDDASVVQPGVHRKDRQEIQSSMAGAFAGPLKGSRVIDQPQDVRFLNEDTAIVISEGGIVFPGQNAVPSEGTVRVTWVLAKRDGCWHVAAYHYSAAN